MVGFTNAIILADKESLPRAVKVCCAILRGWDFRIEKVFSPWVPLWLG